MKGLYIHIPFCKSICSYCDFPKRIGNLDLFTKYIDKLIEEIDSYKDKLNDINTVYIGGGTPNSLPIDLLKRLFIKIKPYLDNSIESTIEVNPELLNIEFVKLIKEYKFNRVSMGVETMNDNLIKILNRHHSKADIDNAFNLLRSNGINNINCDFIFGIPNEAIDDLKNDIDYILKYNPTHLSFYSLIIEDKTALKYRIDKGLINTPDEDLEADFYDYIKNRLKNEGFNHYEISNFSKEGYESLHNLIYWNLDSYIGVGSGASGFIDNIRYDNERVLTYYLKNNNVIKEELSIYDLKNEFMMLGLRKTNGIRISEYQNRFNSSPLIDFKDKLDKLLEYKLIEINDDIIKISYDKLFLANIVWRNFV